MLCLIVTMIITHTQIKKALVVFFLITEKIKKIDIGVGYYGV